MKRIQSFFLFLMCMLLGSVHAQAVQYPEAGKKYQIIHSSGYLLTENGASLKISDVTGATNQVFEFVPVDGVQGAYYMKLQSTGKYILHDGSYTPKWVDDPTGNALAQFVIQDVDGTYIKFKNVSKGNYLGTDKNESNSGVYCDKGGNDGKHYWTLQEPVDPKDMLQESITSVKEFLQGISVGENVGDYPQEAVTAFQSVVTEAENAVNGDLQAVVDARKNLLAAFEILKGTKIAFVVKEGIDYFIQHSSLLILTKDGNAAKLTAPAATDEQKVRFIPVEGQVKVYYIQLTIDGAPYYLAKDNYNLKWVTETSAAGKFKFEMADEEKGLLKVKFTDTNRGLGVDDDPAKVGSSIYADKDGSVPKFQWSLVQIDPNMVFKDFLQNLIGQAQTLVDNSPIGNEGHQFPQEAADALNEAIAAATEALNSAGTQPEINAAVNALSAAIATFKASEITPMLNPKAGDKYRFAVAKYATKYLNNSGGSTGTTATFVAGDEGQLWEMSPVEGNKGTFIFRQGDVAMNENLAMVPVASATPFTLKYIQTTNGIDYFGVLNPNGKVLTFSSGNSATWQDFQTTNNAHQGIFTRANLPNDPNMTDLRAYVPTAQTQLDSKVYGSESGLWSIESRDSLTKVIGEAQIILDGNGNTQEEVNAMLTKLKGTVTWHGNQKITVRLEALQTALTQALAAKGAAVVGTQKGQYYPTVIDAFVSGPIADAQKALKITKQDEVDAATAKLLVDIDAFKAAAHADAVPVDRVLQEVIASAEAFCNSVVPGINKGDYSAASKDAFATAIATAKAAAVTQETLDALLAARATFESSILTVDRSALASAIAAAKKAIDKEVGDFNGQVPQQAIDEYQLAITAAEAVYPNLALTQKEIDVAINTLKEASIKFSAAVIVINFNALKTAISAAEKTMKDAESEKGEGPGYFPVSAFEVLQTAINAAKAVNGSSSVNQATVDQATQAMADAETAFKATRTPNDYSELNAKLTEADELIQNTPVGSNPGEISEYYVTKLLNTITYAEPMLQSTKQDDILMAARSLNKDIALFRKAIVKADITKLDAAIALAEEAIANTGVVTGEKYENLVKELSAAKGISAEPAVAQSVVDAQTDALNAAIQAYAPGTAISTVEWDDLSVFADNGILYIQSLPEKATVTVYDTAGQIVKNVMTEGNLEIALDSASYIVKIQIAGDVKTIRIVVK